MQDDTASYLDRLLLIRGFPGMDTVSSSALSLMAERSGERRFAAGERLLEEGEPVDKVYLVLEGTVSIRRGGKQTAEVLSRGVCGAISVFADEGNGPEAIATSEVRALEIEGKDTSEIFQDNFDLMLLALQSMAIEELQAAKLAGGPRVAATQPPRLGGLTGKLLLLKQAFAFAADHLDFLAAVAEECETLRVSEGARRPAGQIWISTATVECRGLREGLAGVEPEKSTIAGEALALSLDTLLDLFEDHAPIALALVREMARRTVLLRKLSVR